MHSPSATVPQRERLSMMKALSLHQTSKGAMLHTVCGSGRTEPALVWQHGAVGTYALQDLRRAGPCARPWQHLK